ncbi:hypothetical protein ACFQDG_19750, partial [Natronoarchaeum mannanilyticum]
RLLAAAEDAGALAVPGDRAILLAGSIEALRRVASLIDAGTGQETRKSGESIGESLSVALDELLQ